MQAYFCQSPVFDWQWGRLDAVFFFRYSEGEDIKTTFGLKEACMDYDYPLYRPPSEADSVIIQDLGLCPQPMHLFFHVPGQTIYRGAL